MTDASSSPLTCPKCGADVPLDQGPSWCTACGEQLPMELLERMKKPRDPKLGVSEPSIALPTALSVQTEGSIIWARIQLGISAAFLLFGLWRIYWYSASEGPVGGDAYNYIILTNRGVGLIATGVAIAVAACATALLAILRELGQRQPQPHRNNPLHETSQVRDVAG